MVPEQNAVAQPEASVAVEAPADANMAEPEASVAVPDANVAEAPADANMAEPEVDVAVVVAETNVGAQEANAVQQENVPQLPAGHCQIRPRHPRHPRRPLPRRLTDMYAVWYYNHPLVQAAEEAKQ